MADRRAAGVLARNRLVAERAVDLFVGDVALLLELAEHRPDGRVGRRIFNSLKHIGDCAAVLGDEEVHDLALAWGQALEVGSRHFGIILLTCATIIALVRIRSKRRASSKSFFQTRRSGYE